MCRIVEPDGTAEVTPTGGEPIGIEPFQARPASRLRRPALAETSSVAVKGRVEPLAIARVCIPGEVAAG
ncbi:MAG TPA: hypothetical protein VIL55_06375 [Naasia sp.]